MQFLHIVMRTLAQGGKVRLLGWASPATCHLWLHRCYLLCPAGNLFSHFREGKAETQIKDLTRIAMNLVNQTKEIWFETKPLHF